MTFLLQGMLAGAAHVLTGPDHLAGVAPLAAQQRRHLGATWIGASWGLGHGLGVAILGLLGQTVLGIAEVEIASLWAERLVGLVLVGVGITAILRSRGLVVHEHPHQHGDGPPHEHLHVHSRGESGHRHSHGVSVGVGLCHGLAGAGHLWAVLPSLAMEPLDAAVYIGSYLITSVLVMMGFGAAIGSLTRACGPRAMPRLIQVVGAASILVGGLWFAQGFGWI